MLFWVIAALLTFGACLAILLPLAGRAPAAQAAEAHDLEVYRDQLAEVDRDAERGLVGSAEAEQARAEIGRRILRLHPAEDHTAQHGSRPARWAGMAAVLAVPLVSWSIYAAIGSPEIPAQPLQQRLAKNPAESTLEELVARAEAHLAANPSDGRGWEVVAPIYIRVGRHEDAVGAYRNALRLLGANATREAGLGEALTAAAGKVVPEAKAAFERALALDPGDAKSRYFLASADAQEGRTEQAAQALRALAETAPAGSPWRHAADEALRQMAGVQAPGPTQQEADAAAAMSAEERGAMIEGMVASLDARLRQNPRDAEGWKRLIRSYMVLGRTDEARSALERSVGAFGAGSGEAAEIEAFAAALGVTETDRQ